MSQNSSVQDLDHASKRVGKCIGFKTALEEHHWGIVSKFCDGYEKSSPRKEVDDAPLDKVGDIMALLAEELKEGQRACSSRWRNRPFGGSRTKRDCVPELQKNVG